MSSVELTEQAAFWVLRSEGWLGRRGSFRIRGDSDGLAVVCGASAPNLLIVICRCQDCGSNANSFPR